MPLDMQSQLEPYPGWEEVVNSQDEIEQCEQSFPPWNFFLVGPLTNQSLREGRLR